MAIGSGVLLPGVAEHPTFPILRALAYTTGLGYRPTCDNVDIVCVACLTCVLLFVTHIGHKCDNFVVGLTNVSPNISTPTLYNYTLCGQYPGAVPNGTTVSLYCQDSLPPFRYVIVQLPLSGHFVACEVEVLVRGTRMSNINILIFIYHSTRQQFNVVISRETPDFGPLAP